MDKIKEILESVLKNNLIMLHPPLVEKNTIVYEIEELKKWIPKALAQIKQAYEGCVPVEREIDNAPFADITEKLKSTGHNACRTLTLTRMGDIR